MTKIEDLERDKKCLQDEVNEQYEEIKKLKALVRVLVAFIFKRDHIEIMNALDLDI